MNSKRVLAFVITVLISVALLGGCSKGNVQEDTTTKTKENSKEIVIGVPIYTMEHQYWVDWLKAIENKAAELGAKIVSADSTYDPVKQVSIMEDMASKKVDAMIICAVDPQGIAKAIKDVESDGIKVILSDNPVTDEKQMPVGAALIGYDNLKNGRLQAEWVAQYAKGKLNGKANVAVLSYPNEKVCLDAEKGFIDGLKELLGEANVKVYTQNGQATREGGLTVMENILSANNDINICWGANDECALGGLAAMEARGLGKNNELVAGFYTIPDVMKLIKDGKSMFKVSMYLDPKAMGDLAVELAVKAVNNEKVEYTNNVPMEVCTLENVDKFMK